MFAHKVDEDIILKLIDEADAKRVFILMNESREYLREWLPWVDTIKSVDDTRIFIQESHIHYAEHKSLNTVILFKGEIVGVASYNELDWRNKMANIGYWIGEAYQGKGIMIRVAKSLTDYAINQLKFNRVEIRVAQENAKSKAIPEKLRFVKEGCIRQAEWLDGKPFDHLIYGMLAKEWNKE